MAVAQRWKKPTNNPSNKKNPNKSKSNNGKKKAQEKESEEKLVVATELDGFTMGSYAEFVGVLIWELGCCDVKRCYISDTLLFCSADLSKKKTG